MSNIANLFTFIEILVIMLQVDTFISDKGIGVGGRTLRYKRIQLLTEIQQKREKMIETAKKNGMASQETVRCSQELDQLIFEYQCVIKREKEQKKRMRISFREMILSWKKAVV